jgi:hypothetical protein
MSTNMTAEEFAAHAEAYGLSIVKADSDRYAVVERAVDQNGCTSAVAIYEGGRATYIHYNSVHDCSEYIAEDGVIYPADQYEAGAESINTDRAVRIYAVDEESALALAFDFDNARRAVDNTVLGEPGVVQEILK